MKTVAEVLRYIESYYELVIDDPKGFFQNVIQMEVELAELEALYEFIVDDSTTSRGFASRYREFMEGRGYGALGFYGGVFGDDDEESRPIRPCKAPTDEEVAEMNEFGELWREYLSSGKRLKANS